MHILTNQLLTNLEYEIINYLIYQPDLLREVDLQSEHFWFSKSRILFERMLQLQSRDEKISVISVSQGLDKPSEYLDYFSATSSTIGIQSIKDLFDAVDRLKENYTRRLLAEKLQESRDSTEFLQFAKDRDEILKKIQVNSLDQDFKEFTELVQARLKHDDSSPITSWPKFNEMVRMERGNFLIVGARPSIGKTAFCLNLALDAARLNSKVLFVSLEMNKPQLFYRILSNLTKQNSRTFQEGRADLTQAEKAMAELFNSKKLQLLFKPKLTSSDLRQFRGYDLIIIDYLQLLSDESKENENIRIQNISRNLKILAGENNCVVIAAAQLNRDSERAKRKPTLADLRSSGSLEQDADVACLLHREDRKTTTLEIIVAKNRNGEVGDILMDYSPCFNLFMPLT